MQPSEGRIKQPRESPKKTGKSLGADRIKNGARKGSPVGKLKRVTTTSAIHGTISISGKIRKTAEICTSTSEPNPDTKRAMTRTTSVAKSRTKLQLKKDQKLSTKKDVLETGK
ncbi:MAG: hypothetical protein V5A79_06995 [Candidatus Bipolaricaulota bacterium]